MIRFYAPDLEVTCELPDVESAHCARVLRMKAGDTISVVDGRGNVFDCEILDPHPKHTSVVITGRSEEPLHWRPQLTLAVAPTKNMDRMEWLAEKAVEIGVNRLMFVDCERNVRRVVKRDRIEKIMVSAMKQSLKAWLPELVEMTSLSEFIAGDTSAMKFMGYCSPEVERRDFSSAYDGMSNLSILIGPEGDFTPAEVDMALAAGIMPVTFGKTRLRTETAALYALCSAHTLMSINEM